MAGKKGMVMKNIPQEEIERRKRNFAATDEDVVKAAILAPMPDKIHAFLRSGPGSVAKYKTEEELQEAIESYFNSCFTAVTDENGIVTEVRWLRKPTLSGLAIHLGVARETIWNYGKSDLHFHTIKRAKDIIANFTEELLLDGKCVVPAINTLVNLRVGWVASEQNIKIEPVTPDNAARSTEEISAFLDDRALPEHESD